MCCDLIFSEWNRYTVKPLNNEIAGEAIFVRSRENFVVAKKEKIRTQITSHNQNLFQEVSQSA